MTREELIEKIKVIKKVVDDFSIDSDGFEYDDALEELGELTGDILEHLSATVTQ